MKRLGWTLHNSSETYSSCINWAWLAEFAANDLQFHFLLVSLYNSSKHAHKSFGVQSAI